MIDAVNVASQSVAVNSPVLFGATRIKTGALYDMSKALADLFCSSQVSIEYLSMPVYLLQLLPQQF